MTVAETLAALKSEKDIEPSADYAGEETPTTSSSPFRL